MTARLQPFGKSDEKDIDTDMGLGDDTAAGPRDGDDGEDVSADIIDALEGEGEQFAPHDLDRHGKGQSQENVAGNDGDQTSQRLERL